MADSQHAFEELVYNRFIPEYCADPSRRCQPSGFNKASMKVSPFDADWFVKAFNANLIKHVGRGQYRADRSGAKEQFFWTGPKHAEPRPFSLWLEPVITVGALGRLQIELGWPEHLVGMQSSDYVFDLVAFLPGQDAEFIAGEVKKTKAEVLLLLELMAYFGRNPDQPLPPTNQQKHRNAHKKVAALRARKTPLFWAVGPDSLNHVFRVAHGENGMMELLPGALADLRCLSDLDRASTESGPT